jgi:SAM-dependent methyltransferase
MSLLSRLHDGYVATRRADVLAARLSALLPPAARVLDVGCGDGELARCILDRRPDVRVEGVDVFVRPHTAIPVQLFDGVTLPYADASVDVALLVDVLHHTDDPNVLLREVARVARVGVLIKDHTRDGLLAGPTLRAMDWVGNARHGVRLPYNYWSRRHWMEAFADHGLEIVAWLPRLGLYPGPASWVFDRSLHFIALLRPSVVHSPPSPPLPARASRSGR